MLMEGRAKEGRNGPGPLVRSLTTYKAKAYEESFNLTPQRFWGVFSVPGCPGLYTGQSHEQSVYSSLASHAFHRGRYV
jgi:hypothetical protein